MARLGSSLLRPVAAVSLGITLSAGLALAAAPLAASSGDTRPSVSTTAWGPGTELLVCTNGRVDDGGVATSSVVVERAPAGAPVPLGCRLG